MNQKNPLALGTAAFLLLALPACIIVLDGDGHWDNGTWHGHSSDAVRGSGTAKTETRNVGDFHRIQILSGADMEVSVGSPASLTITGDDNLLAYHVTEVRDGTLVVEMRSGSYAPKVRLKIVATVPALDSVVVRGSSDLELAGIAAEQFSIEIAGSGDAHAKGKVGNLTARITGSGNLRLAELEAREANVEISGSGNVDVWATGTLLASVSGSGDVVYRGDPKVTKSVAGSGTITQK